MSRAISDSTPLPVVDGFRQRGLETTRLETFTDAAFAFALTLLVISFDKIPASMAEFQLALKNIPAFAASFAQISLFWYAHHVWSRRYGLDDAITALLSLMLVFVTLVYVFPLRVVFAGLFAWISSGWLPFTFDERIQGSEMGWIFFVYGIGFAAMCLLIALHYRHAERSAVSPALDAHERFETAAAREAWIIVGIIGLASSVHGLAAPAQWAPFAGFWYCSLPPAMWLFDRLKRRQAASVLNRDKRLPG